MKTEIEVSVQKGGKVFGNRRSGKIDNAAVPSDVDTPDAKQEKDFVVDEMLRQLQFERPVLPCTALENNVPNFSGCGENSTVWWDMVDCDQW